MKALIAAVAAGTLLFGSAAYAGVIHDRQLEQQARIEQGVDSGALTPHETRTLRTQQRVIARTRNRALSDGVIGAREARHLTREQNHASRDIYRLKHNARMVVQE